MTTYVVTDLDVFDPDVFAEYQRRFPAILERHGGRYLVRGGEVTTNDDWGLHRVVIFEFPDRDAIRATFSDPEYAPLVPIRERSARARTFMVDGWDGIDPH